MSNDANIKIEIRDLTMAYGSFVVMRDINAQVRRGEVFIIMGGSGCGKSTLLKHMIGLLKPAHGDVVLHDKSLWHCTPEHRETLMRRIGVLYQSSALFSSLTLAENVALPLGEFTRYTASEIRDIASYKLALVGLAGFEDYYPAEISGGMQKRAGLARAIALDPEILFFDEPSSGLDPVSSRLLDDLIISLRETLGTTIVLVTHELASLFAIGTNSVFLDSESKTMLATGSPHTLLAESRDPRIQQFLTRGEYHA
jgi:phospholipid/cholesterol/gamma-HCH transport system ATP-binding protein